jgi:hypothetical protein
MVEHGFRKAGVEGSSPSFGFLVVFAANWGKKQLATEQVFIPNDRMG